MGFSAFAGDIFNGLQIEGKVFFGQFVFDVASVTCVILNCAVMLATHEWLCVWQATTVALFILLVDGCDDQQLSICILSNTTCIGCSHYFNSLQQARQRHTISDGNVANKKGAKVLHIVLTAPRICRYASCWCFCVVLSLSSEGGTSYWRVDWSVVLSTGRRSLPWQVVSLEAGHPQDCV